VLCECNESDGLKGEGGLKASVDGGAIMK